MLRVWGGAAAMPSGEGQGREGPEGETCATERDFLMGLLLSMEEQIWTICGLEGRAPQELFLVA